MSVWVQDAGQEAAPAPDQAAAVAQQAEQAGAAKAGYVQLSAEDALVEHYLRAALPSKVQIVQLGPAQAALDCDQGRDTRGTLAGPSRAPRLCGWRETWLSLTAVWLFVLQVAMLDALSGEAEEGWRQAAAADAAVAAVAKVTSVSRHWR